MLLPPVLRFNADHVGDKYRRLAQAMGFAADADLAAFIEDLNGRIGLPRSLKEMGVPARVIPEMAAKAEKDHTNPTNPRQATAADYQRLLRERIGHDGARRGARRGGPR